MEGRKVEEDSSEHTDGRDPQNSSAVVFLTENSKAWRQMRSSKLALAV